MPSTQLRKQLLPAAKSVVIKLGTQLLTGRDGRIDARYIGRIAKQIVALRHRGVEVTLVSSGAIGCGCAELGLTQRPTDLPDQQAVAAVGQRRLMTRWHDAFERHDMQVAQLLLTRDDFDNRSRFLNIRNCVARLHELGCIPIINENDTVAVDELRFGENDLLAALTCNALRGEALVLLTVVDGLLDGQGNKIDLVDDIGVAMGHTREVTSRMGTGGMATKLQAAKLVTHAGEIAVIANGRMPNVLTRLFAAEPGVGTVVVPSRRKLDSRRRWIALTKRSSGSVAVDAGAARALLKGGKSLLPIGVTAVHGTFKKGAALDVLDPDGKPIARGLTNYDNEELNHIKGKRSNQFEKILGRPGYAEVIHRDNLVLAEAPA
jgi:glutamate 5-kinase